MSIKRVMLASAFAIMGFSASAYSSSMTCNQMDVKTSSGEEHGYGYPTKFTENDNQVGFILVNKQLTLPPFHEVSDGVYGTKAPNYVLVKRFLGEEVVYILQVKSSGEKILFRECS
ncbi:hypothetical protein ACK08B_22695 [Pantoea dispersa]|uniref:hypothetical protein n=1 Tax=Pantoea dispersa TaxID=59814 RepID=UPI0039897A2D